ncbi:MAG: hypothetical protein AAF802_03265 [Planctomycetota bacterium]
MSFDPSEQWRNFELLPESYFQRERAKHALFAWTIVLLALAVLLTVALTFGLRHELSLALHPIAELDVSTFDVNATSVSLGEHHVTEQEIEQLELENRRASKWCRLAETLKPDSSGVRFAWRMEEVLKQLARDEGVELTIHSVDLIHSTSSAAEESYSFDHPTSMTVSISIRGLHDIDAWLKALDSHQVRSATEVVASTKIRDQTRYTISMTMSDKLASRTDQ